MATTDDWGELPEVNVAPPPEQSPSILGRIGQRAANTPSEFFNSLLRLSYNLGFTPGGDAQPVEVPKPFNIPAAKTLGETSVDIGANLAESLPLFLTGEGAGAGFSKLADLGPLATNVTKLAAGFGLQGLSESPTDAAVGTGTGAAFGAVEKIAPLKYRAPAAMLLGLLTGGASKLQGADNTQAAVTGVTNALLPLVTGMKFGKRLALPEPEVPQTINGELLFPRLGYRESIGLREIPQQLGPPEEPGYGRAIGLREIPGTGEPPAQFRLSSAEPPEGSLIREPIFTESEANQIANTKQARAQAVWDLLKGNRTEPTSSQPFLKLGPPSGSLIREPTFTEGEISNYLARRPVDDNKIIQLPTGEAVPAVQPPPPSDVATPAANAAQPSGRLLLRTVLSHEAPEMAQKAADKLGLRYDGVFGADVEGFTPHLQYTFPADAPHAAAKATFTVESGTTYAGLKNKVRSKIAEFEGTPSPDEIKVATLQSSDGMASTASSPEKETVPQTPLPKGIKIGDPVVARINGERIEGTLQPTVESGTHRIVASDGTPYDVRPATVKGVEVRATPGEKVIGEKEQSIGGLNEIVEAMNPDKGNIMKLRGGGIMRKSNFGEHGSVEPELLKAFARYGLPSIAGGLAGALYDHDHPIVGAIEGALMIGAISHFGPKAVRALMHAYPEIEKAAAITDKSLIASKAIGKETLNLGRALTASSAMTDKVVNNFTEAMPLDKLARWVEKNFTTDAAVKLVKGKAFGAVQVLSKQLNDSLQALAAEKDFVKNPEMQKALLKYWTGGNVNEFHNAIKDRSISSLAVTAQTSSEALQRIAIEGLGKGKLSAAIENNFGKYLTTAYRIFHEDKYLPTDAQLLAVAKTEQMIKDFGPDLDLNFRTLQDYIHEIKVNREFYRGSASGRGAKLDTLLTRPENLTNEFKDMLGIYNDPIHRMAATSLKLTQAARSAELFNEIAKGVDENGLKYAMSTNEYSTTLSNLKVKAATSFGEAKQKLDQSIATLQQYIRVPVEASKGRLSGQWVTRQMRDQLSTFDSTTSNFKTAWGQQLANATNFIKLGHTVLSPLQFTRQVISIPFLSIMARVSPQNLMDAFKTFTDRSVEGLKIRDDLISKGIWGGDIIGGMFRKDMEKLLSGNLDSVLHNNILTKGLNSWGEVYRGPDLIVRIAGYLKGLDQADALGKTGADAIDHAINYTNRYTINYAAAPPGIQKLRQFPFVNQYLTFAYEIMRISKNLMQDVIQRRDISAATVLGGMATAPFILQKLSESQLSAKDKVDWEMVKSLAPDYSRMNFKFVHGRDANGDFHYTDYTPLLIHDHWLKMLRALGSGDIHAVLAENPVFGWENTPLLNVAVNQISGKDLHSHEKLDDWSSRLNSLRKDVMPTLFGGTDTDKIVDALTPNADGTLGLTNARSGATSSISQILTSYLTATRGYTVRPEALVHSTIAAAKEEINNQQSILRKVYITNASQDIKQRALDRYQARVKDIVATLQSQIHAPDTTQGLSSQ